MWWGHRGGRRRRGGISVLDFVAQAVSTPPLFFYLVKSCQNSQPKNMLLHLHQVISHLLAQTSRQELLSMLYELELRRHRDTHRLLSAASSQLHSWRTERERRTVSPFHFSPVPSSSPKVTSMPVMCM